MRKWVVLLIILGGIYQVAAFEPVYLPPSQIPVNYVFTVDRTGDESDRNIGDGVCDISVNAGDQCTLRAAIEELNALGPGVNPHRIRFDIAGSGVHVITPNSPLPPIDVPVHINGVTQSGAACPTADAPAELLIQLDGPHLGANQAGLFLNSTSDGSTISGLIVTNFDGYGLAIHSDDVLIICNVIGLDAAGVVAKGNGVGVVLMGQHGELGGGADPAQRNVISASEAVGVLVWGDQNTIAGNYIGTTADGLHAMSNAIGIHDEGDTTHIDANVISGNETGLQIFASGTQITSNAVGVAADGQSPLPNRGHGIYIFEGLEITIGAANAGNTIAFNEGAGVKVEANLGVGGNSAIRFNAIYANNHLGIDLGADGVTANDNDDVDAGANNLQNFPVLTARPAGFIVDGALNATPSTSFTIDAYRSADCDPSNYGEGETYAGTMAVTTNGLGDAFFALDLRGELANGDYVTATATDPDGNTSEFSRCVRVGSPKGLTLTVNQAEDWADALPGDGVCDASANAGEQCTLRAALQEINALGAISDTYQVQFDISAAGIVTITPQVALPAVKVPVEIDGTTQPGSSCGTGNEPAQLKVVLDGRDLLSGNGLILDDGSDGSLVRGLVIGNFRTHGLLIYSTNNLIVCNHIGLAADGITPLPNRFFGLYIDGSSNQIGGTGANSRRNVISANEGDGIFIRYTSNFNLIGGNFIGTTADGQQTAGNGGSGITVSGDLNVVGGHANLGNVISGNGRDGITIYFANNVQLSGNVIGLTRDQQLPLPNAAHGVHITGDSSLNLIGGTSGLGNHIAANGGHGVLIDEHETSYGSGNRIRQNAIHGNGLLGIDLGGDGVDAIDPGDVDDGVNTRQNHPVLMVTPGSQLLRVELQSTPNTIFDLDLFQVQSCDLSGFGEGDQYVRSGVLTTDASGVATATLDLTGFVDVGTALTAVVTRVEDGNSSEFSNCVVLIRADLEHTVYLPLVER